MINDKRANIYRACMQEGGGDEEAANPEDDSKFDEFLGNDAGAFASKAGEYDQDDKEADGIWEAVDAFMDERRRVSVNRIIPNQ